MQRQVLFSLVTLLLIGVFCESVSAGFLNSTTIRFDLKATPYAVFWYGNQLHAIQDNRHFVTLYRYDSRFELQTKLNLQKGCPENQDCSLIVRAIDIEGSMLYVPMMLNTEENTWQIVQVNLATWNIVTAFQNFTSAPPAIWIRYNSNQAYMVTSDFDSDDQQNEKISLSTFDTTDIAPINGVNYTFGGYGVSSANAVFLCTLDPNLSTQFVAVSTNSYQIVSSTQFNGCVQSSYIDSSQQLVTAYIGIIGARSSGIFVQVLNTSTALPPIPTATFIVQRNDLKVHTVTANSQYVFVGTYPSNSVTYFGVIYQIDITHSPPILVSSMTTRAIISADQQNFIPYGLNNNSNQLAILTEDGIVVVNFS